MNNSENSYLWLHADTVIKMTSRVLQGVVLHVTFKVIERRLLIRITLAAVPLPMWVWSSPIVFIDFLCEDVIRCKTLSFSFFFHSVFRSESPVRLLCGDCCLVKTLKEQKNGLIHTYESMFFFFAKRSRRNVFQSWLLMTLENIIFVRVTAIECQCGMTFFKIDLRKGYLVLYTF